MKQNILYIIKNNDELYVKRNKAQKELNDWTHTLYCDDVYLCEDDAKNEKLQSKIAKLNKKIEILDKQIKEREDSLPALFFRMCMKIRRVP